MGNRSSNLTCLIAGAIAVVGSLLYAAKASAVVTADPLPLPLNGFVGLFRGSSCVAVGTFWFVTAKHTGDGTGQGILMRGQWYTIIETVPHPTFDVQLLRVAEAVPGFHNVASDVRLGDPCLLGGWGATAGAALPSNTGYDWTGPHTETWGENSIEGEGNLLAVRFDSPTSNLAVVHEAIFAVNDSGGGLFIPGPGGSLELAGIAISVMGWGSSQYTTAAFCLNIDLFRNWMAPIVDPSRPVSSAVEAPRGMISIPGLPAWAGGMLLAVTLAGRRRR
jgi:hypothetical protein